MIELQRGNLAWALRAVLPHVGAHEPTNAVGLGDNLAWATDGYTLGVAQIGSSGAPQVWLPAGEARELERALRVQRKADEDESVWLVQQSAELHVQIGEAPGEVYNLAQSGVSARLIGDYLTRLRSMQPERQGLIVQPKWLDRFAKAARFDADRIRLDGYNRDAEHGDIFITVGEAFIGAIAGMTYHGLAVGQVAA